MKTRKLILLVSFGSWLSICDGVQHSPPESRHMPEVCYRTGTAKLQLLSSTRIGWFLFAIVAIAAPRAVDAAVNASRDEPAAVNRPGVVGGTTSIDSSFVIDNYWFLSMMAPTTLDGTNTLSDAGVIWGNGTLLDDVGINEPTSCGISMNKGTVDGTSLTILWYNGSMCGR